MSKKTKTFDTTGTFDHTIKADAAPTTDKENVREMLPGIGHDGPLTGEGPEPHAHLELVGVPGATSGGAFDPDELRADEADTDEGQRVSITHERTGADIVADLLASKLRLECEQARWDALADELGKRAKSQHATRIPVRVGGAVYRFKLTKETKSYSLVEAVEPGEIK